MARFSAAPSAASTLTTSPADLQLRDADRGLVTLRPNAPKRLGDSRRADETRDDHRPLRFIGSGNSRARAGKVDAVDLQPVNGQDPAALILDDNLARIAGKHPTLTIGIVAEKGIRHQRDRIAVQPDRDP
jgi:hypothetical protein